MTRGRAALHVGCALGVGALSYVVLRGSGVALLVRHALPRVVVGSLADGLWAYALGVAMASVWRGGSKRSAWVWLAIGLVVAAAMELLQAWGVIRGVFDPNDLIAMMGGYGLGVFAGCCGRRSQDPADRSSFPARAK